MFLEKICYDLSMKIEASLMIEMYRSLQRTRALENQIYYLYHSQNPEKPLIIGKGYLSTGQEAISVGCAYTLEKEDWVAPSHRDMGLFLVRGVPVREIFAQYFNRSTGMTRGRDSNVHFGYEKKNIPGFVSHMGANVPVANGLAWASKYRNEKNIVMTMFGDGASSQGCVHEAMNYAAVFKLPVVMVLNNNRYAISTPVHQQTALENLADRAKAYGFEGKVCDGNDVLAVYEAVKPAVDKAREGGGPTLIECKSFRAAGHGTHDPANYIPQEEKDFWKKKDPVEVMRRRLEEMKLWDDKKENVLQEELKKEMNEATAWAAAQPLPNAEDLLDGVYSSPS